MTDPAEAAELLERAGEEASIAARPDDAELYLREAVRLHREHGEMAMLARAGARLGRAMLTVYHTDAALEVLTEIAAEIGELRESPDGIAIDMMLARTQWLRDEPRTALQIADRVLALAEQLDLVSIVAETMLIRGGALNDMGQTYEGIAVMEGALRLADQHGLVSVALRGRNSLAGYLMARDPQAAVQLLVSGAAESRRVGYRANLIRLLTNAAGGWVETGEWALARREMEELLGGPLGREDRLFAVSGLVIPKVWTGEDCADELREMETLLEGERDGNVLNVGVGTRAVVHIAAGDYAAAIGEAIESARLSPFNAPSVLSMAAHAATWNRDADALGAVLGLHIATAAHGGVIDLRRAAIRAALAGLEGRGDEAAHGFRSALEGLRALGARNEEALTTLDLVAAVGEAADPAAVESARAYFTNLGARPFLARLDELLDSSHKAPRPSPTATPVLGLAPASSGGGSDSDRS